jgi:transcription elongation regulator 1
VFYYNPVSGESYWRLPEGIRGVVEGWMLESARAGVAEEEEEEESDEDDQVMEEEEGQVQGDEFTEEDIAYQLSLMQTEYEEPEPEEELDSVAKRQIFISLLEDKEVNPFSPWESEVSKIVHDPRYAMYKTTKHRTETFEEWARARIALIKEEKEQEVKEDVPPTPGEC